MRNGDFFECKISTESQAYFRCNQIRFYWNIRHFFYASQDNISSLDTDNNEHQADVDGLSKNCDEINGKTHNYYYYSYATQIKSEYITFRASETKASCFNILCCIVATTICTFQTNKMKLHG